MSQGQASVLFACIAHGTTILSEHNAASGVGSNASSTRASAESIGGIPAIVLPQIKHDKPAKLTFVQGDRFVHYIACAAGEFPAKLGKTAPSAGKITFLAVTPKSAGQRVPFAFLLEVRDRFFEQFSPSKTDFALLPSYGCAAFNGTLRGMMSVAFATHRQVGGQTDQVTAASSAGATSSGSGDAIHALEDEIDSVRKIMQENVERVLERGERLDTLVDKTATLGAGARDFRMRSQGLRRRMWWKNIRLMALLIVVGIFLLYLIIGAACGLPGYSKCF